MKKKVISSSTTTAKKVYVGMSGGVDSSVAAALLVEQGYDVIGVYMKNWTKDLPGMICPWREDVADAKRVAVRLNIPFKVFDFQKEYKQMVVDYMIKAYKAGLTPNPDIMCNQEIKFKLFFEAALKDGADMIATGHYARIVQELSAPENEEWSKENGEKQKPYSILHTPCFAKLCLASDQNKDQTYFLYRVTKEALSKTLFPIGEFPKETVRRMAAKRGLITADKKDSQGICFVGKVGIKGFLSHYIKTKPGNIIDQTTKQVIGQHDGAIFYTLGQRHGLDIGRRLPAGQQGGLPHYIVGKDMTKNEIFVTTDLADQSLWRTTLHLTALHWINPTPKGNVPLGVGLRVRLRHRAPFIDCTLVGDTLRLAQPQRAIAPGQSAVLYDKTTCLGGGIVV